MFCLGHYKVRSDTNSFWRILNGYTPDTLYSQTILVYNAVIWKRTAFSLQLFGVTSTTWRCKPVIWIYISDSWYESRKRDSVCPYTVTRYMYGFGCIKNFPVHVHVLVAVDETSYCSEFLIDNETNHRVGRFNHFHCFMGQNICKSI